MIQRQIFLQLIYLSDFSLISKGSCQNWVFVGSPVESGQADRVETARENNDCRERETIMPPLFSPSRKGRMCPMRGLLHLLFTGQGCLHWRTDINCSFSSRSCCCWYGLISPSCSTQGWESAFLEAVVRNDMQTTTQEYWNLCGDNTQVKDLTGHCQPRRTCALSCLS